MSNWQPDATVTVNGTTYTSQSLAGVQITYGRNSIWEQPRAGYAVVNILNSTNTDYGFNIDQPIVVKVKNSSGTDITVFTGKITDISNKMARVGSTAQVATQQLTAVSPLAQMARTTISASFPKEFDDVRMTTILTDAGVSVDTIDSPGVYEFKAITANDTDSYSLAAKYAKMAFGYIYDTTDGKVGFANESRRFVNQRDYGYLDIPPSYILGRDVSSNKTRINLLNDVLLSYGSGSSVTSTDSGSISTYGLSAGTIDTELHNSTDAQYQADRYITLRSTPRTSVGQMTIPLDSSLVSDSKRNSLLSIYQGMPITVTGLPLAIKNTVYRGFVEGWNLLINRKTASLTIRSTDASLSIVPTRWQDVQSTLQWNAVGSTIQWYSYDDI